MSEAFEKAIQVISDPVPDDAMDQLHALRSGIDLMRLICLAT